MESGIGERVGRKLFLPLIPYALKWKWLRHVPPIRGMGAVPPWPAPSADIPERLRTVAGIWRDPEAEERSYAEGTPYSFLSLYGKQMWQIISQHGWAFLLPSAPRIHRQYWLMQQVLAAQPAGPPPDADPQELTDEIRGEAERVGLSAVGFAPYDP